MIQNLRPVAETKTFGSGLTITFQTILNAKLYLKDMKTMLKVLFGCRMTFLHLQAMTILFDFGPNRMEISCHFKLLKDIHQLYGV